MMTFGVIQQPPLGATGHDSGEAGGGRSGVESATASLDLRPVRQHQVDQEPVPSFAGTSIHRTLHDSDAHVLDRAAARSVGAPPSAESRANLLVLLQCGCRTAHDWSDDVPG